MAGQRALGSILVFLLTRGPGALSLDYIIERYFAKGGEQSPIEHVMASAACENRTV